MEKKIALQVLAISSLGAAHLLTAASWRDLDKSSAVFFQVCTWNPIDVDDWVCVWQITKMGRVKRTDIKEFKNATSKAGIRSIDLDEGDSVVAAFSTRSEGYIVVATREGKVTRFHSSDVRNFGRLRGDVRAILLEVESRFGSYPNWLGDATCDAFFVPENVSDSAVVGWITELGFAVRFPLFDVKVVGRGQRGVLGVRLTPESGPTAAVGLANSGMAIDMVASDATEVTLSWLDVPIRNRIARLAPDPSLRRTPVMANIQRNHHGVLTLALSSPPGIGAL